MPFLAGPRQFGQSSAAAGRLIASAATSAQPKVVVTGLLTPFSFLIRVIEVFGCEGDSGDNRVSAGAEPESI